MNAAIYFHSEAYSTNGPKLMGRNAAGESFIRAFLIKNSHVDNHIYIEDRNSLNSFQKLTTQLNCTQSFKYISRNNHNHLAQLGALFYPGPNISRFSLLRNFFGHNKWSITGITHTTSSAGAMDSIAELLTSPIHPWDALICTSNSVKSTVEKILDAQFNFLKSHLGASKVSLPQLPVIPLGVNLDDFSFTQNEIIEARNHLNIDNDSIVVLYVGRLSFHAKAHPLAMYQALELSSRKVDVPIVLIECGWYANQSIADSFAEAARKFCPSVKVIHLDGRIPENRNLAWSSADIFCSLPDNIQETFGIVPIEAMAAGLPVVVSDWDGYKDTVRDEIDGFRIPTLIPEPGLGADLAQRYSLDIDTYDMYCGYTSSLISVDVLSASRAFTKLIQSPSLREAMGASGFKRAKELYDWSIIYKKYELLWADLDTIRNKSESNDVYLKSWPGRVNPFQGFSSYASSQLSLNSKLGLVEDDLEGIFDRYISINDLKMVSFAAYILPTNEEVKCIFNNLSHGEMVARDLLSSFEINRRPYILRMLVWLIKLNFIKLV